MDFLDFLASFEIDVLIEKPDDFCGFDTKMVIFTVSFPNLHID